jgi:hypothetical protein
MRSLPFLQLFHFSAFRFFHCSVLRSFPVHCPATTNFAPALRPNTSGEYIR